VFAGDQDENGVRSGLAVMSRWPIGRHELRRLPGPEDGAGAVLFAEIDGPRGPVQLFVAALAWRLEHSGVRQAQVRETGAFISEIQRRRYPTILCGDFNADPDSDEIRMLTGKAEPAAPGLVFYDAWEMAGNGGPGHTWARANSWAAPVLWPDRRIDHVFSAWPRRGGAGHPVRCEVIGIEAIDGVLPSDHYGVLADVRY
jgi:endonuclease/exonuclease/phosphatase family metal-dependent hydrolase